ncbi:MAG: cytidine deaminase [Gemmatimonadaceae bacterium]
MTVPGNGVVPEAVVQRTFDVMRRAYAPYSRFRVGATLVTDEGIEFHGCNVENSSFPAGICAERAALSAAVAGGHRRFSLLVVATEATEPTPPCGLCRQALVEFAPKLQIVSAALDGRRVSWHLDELLPAPFTPDSLTHP